MIINLSLTSQLVKPLKYYVNKVYRKKALPETGSIIYNDFGLSGIYIGNNEIVTINSHGTLGESKEVRKIPVEDFLKKSRSSDGLYVSSDNKGALKNNKVAAAARQYIGEKNDFGLIFKDSNSLIRKCLD